MDALLGRILRLVGVAGVLATLGLALAGALGGVGAALEIALFAVSLGLIVSGEVLVERSRRAERAEFGTGPGPEPSPPSTEDH